MSHLALTRTLLGTPVLTPQGIMAVPWQQFFRDLYARVGESNAPSNAVLGTDLAMLTEDVHGAQDSLEALLAALAEQADAILLAALAPVGAGQRGSDLGSEPWATFILSDVALDNGPVVVASRPEDFGLGGTP